jgi:quercetin dioxygenase-like cupin family protein
MDIVVSKITVAPGGSSGWHSHPGGAIVVVQQGEITIYKSAGKGDDEGSQSQSDREGGVRFPHCVITRYTQGQAFSEGPGDVVDAVNTGSTDFVLFVTFPGVPVGGASRIDQPNPGTCPV